MFWSIFVLRFSCFNMFFHLFLIFFCLVGFLFQMFLGLFILWCFSVCHLFFFVCVGEFSYALFVFCFWGRVLKALFGAFVGFVSYFKEKFCRCFSITFYLKISLRVFKKWFNVCRTIIS